ncbi:MAG: TrmH family RNA methyltransferase [Balneolaceae bacterium]
MNKASANQVKGWRKLSQKKYRYQSGLFIAEGERCVEQIFENRKVKVDAIILSEESSVKAPLHGDIPLFIVSAPVFKSITDTDTPQGIAAICNIPAEPTVGRFKNETGIIVALDAVQDPGNLGTIIRTASWFGAKALLAGDGTVDPYHPKVVRSTAGATGALQVISGELSRLIGMLEKNGWRTYILDIGEQSEDLNKIEKADRAILVAGNEAKGISPALLTGQRRKIKIERCGSDAESLNVSVALGICLYHMSTN